MVSAPFGPVPFFYSFFLKSCKTEVGKVIGVSYAWNHPDRSVFVARDRIYIYIYIRSYIHSVQRIFNYRFSGAKHVVANACSVF